jgi:hypothetical protein
MIKVPNTTGQVRLRITSRSSVGAEVWCIDNIELLAPLQTIDAGIVEIMHPLDSTAVLDSVHPVVRIRNVGNMSIQSATIRCKVDTLYPNFFSWNGILLPDDSLDITLHNAFVTPFNPYRMTLTVSVMGDFNAANDTLSKVVSTYYSPVDIGVSSIHSPLYDTTYFEFSGYFDTVKVWVQNYGSTVVKQFKVKGYFFGDTHLDFQPETWSGILHPGDSVLHTLVKKQIVSCLPGYYDYCFYTQWKGDGNLANDTNCRRCLGLIHGKDKHEFLSVSLGQNRPNPAGDNTRIEFSLPNAGKVVFEVHNLLGNVVFSEQSDFAAGSNHIELDMQSWPAGVYSYSILFNGIRLVKKMVVVR